MAEVADPRPSLPRGEGAVSRESAVCARVFWTWLLVRTVLWTVMLFLVQPNPSLDVVEMLVWGRERQWGYHKHPPLPAWLAELFYQASGGSFLGVYFAGYLCVALTVWAVWRLAGKLLAPRLALLSALALDAILYYNWFGQEFNHNVVVTTFWTLTACWGLFALRTGRVRSWLLLGCFAGLGVQAKYSLVFLALPLLLFLVLEPTARQVWKTPGPYVALTAATFLFLPHLVWLVRNDFPTLRYALARTEPDDKENEDDLEGPRPAPPNPWGRVTYPAHFALNQALALLPLGLLVLPALTLRRRPVQGQDALARRYLWTVILGPFLVQIALAGATGMALRPMWGMSLWALAGLAIFHTWELKPPDRVGLHLGRAFVLAGAVFFFGAMGQALVFSRPSRSHFPGKRLAEEVTHLWRQRCGTPLSMVAGGYWLAGTVSLWAPDRPRVYASPWPDPPLPSPVASPWASDEDFLRTGGVLLWDATRYGERMPRPLQARFPTAEPVPILTLPTRGEGKKGPARIGVALVPPS